MHVDIIAEVGNKDGMKAEQWRIAVMRLGALLGDFHLEKVRLGPAWANVEISFSQNDQDAAWELYVEMLLRIVTQPLPDQDGDEKTALDSVYALFPVTREILQRRGRGTIEFSKIAIPVLNQVVRPFTARWHRESLAGAFDDPDKRMEFREALTALQADLRNYNRLLAKIAGVEDLTDLELTTDMVHGSN